MFVNLARYRNFRNIDGEEIKFSRGVNVLYGGNAEGKTSAVEGIYICSAGRSHRTVHETELIKSGAEFGNVSLEFTDSRRKREIEMYFLKNGKKSCFVNSVPVKKMSEFVGVFKAVIFCPEHLSIVKDGPSVRRNFIDRGMSKDDRGYMESLQRYNGALAQRNKLLSDMMMGDRSGEDTLESWDIMLSKCAEEISEKREKYIKRLDEYTKLIFSDMTGGKETPEVIYKGGYTSDGLLKKLRDNRQREIKNGITLFGVHKDDMEISIGSMPSRIYASQGQQRSLAIALKLSEGEITAKNSGEYPVYLLDDILSELDEKRRNYLISDFSKADKQVMITCCDDSLLKNNDNINRIYVKNGKYTEIK